MSTDRPVVCPLPGVEIDPAQSTLKLAGVVFPACAPFLEDDEIPWGGYNSHVDPPDWEVWVPTENGLLIEVYIGRLGHDAPLAICLTLNLGVVTPDGACDGHTVFNLLHGWVDGGTIRPAPADDLLSWFWAGCEPDWAAEHIARLARMPVIMDGVKRDRAVIRPLSEVSW